MYQKHTGIILKKFPLAEHDELLTLYTKELGKIRIKARGVRKINSKLAGHIQTLNEVEVETASRSQKNAIPVLVSVRLKNLNRYLRDDLRNFSVAQVASETLYRITPDEEPAIEIYESFSKFLQNIGKSGIDRKLLLRKFQLDLMKICGYMFSLDQCVETQKDLNTCDRIFFNSRLGGLLHEDKGLDFPNSVVLDKNQFQILQDLIKGKSVMIGPEIEEVIEGFLHYVLEREIKSEKFAKSIAEN